VGATDRFGLLDPTPGCGRVLTKPEM
jgi:hypothetical protein